MKTSVLLLILSAIPSAASATTLSVPSRAFPTIQSALNAALSGDEISVAPGTYTEALSISRTLTLSRVAGATGTVQISAPLSKSPQPTIKLTSASMLVILRDLTIRGGRSGIEGYGSAPSTSAPIPTLLLENVVIQSPGPAGGISAFMNLCATNLGIYSSAGPGIAIVGGANLTDVYVWQSAGIGISIRNSFASPTFWSNRLERVESYNNGASGLYLFDSTGSAFSIADSAFAYNKVSGIYLDQTRGPTIQNTVASANLVRADGAYGDGLVVVATPGVMVSGSHFDSNARAGASVFGCASTAPADASLQNCTIFSNPIMMDEEVFSAGCSMSAKFNDLGGNLCSDSNGIAATCRAESSSPIVPSPI